MAPPQRSSSGSTVFVGNINYDATEDQLKDIFSQVGVVVNFRVVYDQETGRPKGYGFCEYEDAETAMSARRNLNGYELNGRQLRVDFTESDKPGTAAAAAGQGGGQGASGRNGVAGGKTGEQLLPDALGGPNPSLAMLTLPQIHEVMLQLKRAATEYPNELRDLLAGSPQLAHAVLQGQIMLGMIPLPPPPPPPAAANVQGMPGALPPHMAGQLPPMAAAGGVPGLSMAQPEVPAVMPGQQPGLQGPSPGVQGGTQLMQGQPPAMAAAAPTGMPGVPPSVHGGPPGMLGGPPGMVGTGMLGLHPHQQQHHPQQQQPSQQPRQQLSQSQLAGISAGQQVAHGQGQGHFQGAMQPGMHSNMPPGVHDGRSPMPQQMSMLSQGAAPARMGGVVASESQQSQPLMEQAALLKQVMEMTREQIELLPPDQQAQVLQLQALAAANSIHSVVGGVGPAGAGGRPYM